MEQMIKQLLIWLLVKTKIDLHNSCDEEQQGVISTSSTSGAGIGELLTYVSTHISKNIVLL